MNHAFNTVDAKLCMEILNKSKAQLLSYDSELGQIYIDLYTEYAKFDMHIDRIPLSTLDRLIRRAEETQSISLLIDIKTSKAWNLNHKKKYRASIKCYLQIHQLIQTEVEVENNNYSYFYYTLAHIFYKFKDYKKTTQFAKLGLKDNPHNIQRLLLYDLIGRCNSILKKHQAAESNFRMCYSLASKTHLHPDVWRGISLGNRGINFLEQGKFKKAEKYLLLAISLCEEQQLADNLGRFYPALAKIDLLNHQYKRAKEHIDKADKYYLANKIEENLLSILAVKTSYYSQTNNFQAATKASQDFIQLQDKLRKEFDINIKYLAEFELDQLYEKARVTSLKTEISSQKTRRNFLLYLFVLAFLLVLFYYNRLRLRNRHREELALQEQKMSRAELDRFSQLLIHKNEQIEIFKNQLESNSSNEAIEQLKTTSILTDTDWEDFRKLFDKVFPKFLSSLKSKCPNLTPAEIRFCALHKLQLNNKEMASILGVGSEAIRSIRSRMKKKLSESEERELLELLPGV